MAKVSTFLLSVVATLLLSGSTAGQENLSIEAQGPRQQQLAEWAFDRYAEAGLELPPLTVKFLGPNLADCDGSLGRAYLDHDPIEVRMCWNGEFILLHELAHVWEAHNVPKDKHEPFMNLRSGILSWASLDVAWSERGREHAANVIAWGLLEDPYPVSRTYPNDPDSLLAAFQILTDTQPLHDGGQPIQEPDRSLFGGRDNRPLESGR
jgi:hypothetical protein